MNVEAEAVADARDGAYKHTASWETSKNGKRKLRERERDGDGEEGRRPPAKHYHHH